MQLDGLTIFALILLVLIFGALLIGSFSVKLSRFLEERRYINMELQRCRAGQRKYWLQKRRRSWMLLLPFYRG